MKTDFSIKWHPKIIGIIETPIRHFMMPHNNIGFNSINVPKIWLPKLQKWPILTSPLSFEAPRHGTPTNIRINLIHPESSPWAIFAVYIHCVPKRIADIFDCNLKKDYHILIAFGKNIPDTTGHQMLVQFLTSPIVSVPALPWEIRTSKILHFYSS